MAIVGRDAMEKQTTQNIMIKASIECSNNFIQLLKA